MVFFQNIHFHFVSQYSTSSSWVPIAKKKKTDATALHSVKPIMALVKPIMALGFTIHVKTYANLHSVIRGHITGQKISLHES
jgi:hypothetical protein